MCVWSTSAQHRAEPRAVITAGPQAECDTSMNSTHPRLAASCRLLAWSLTCAALTGSGISALCSFAWRKIILQTLPCPSRSNNFLGLFILKYWNLKEQLWCHRWGITASVWPRRKGRKPWPHQSQAGKTAKAPGWHYWSLLWKCCNIQPWLC